MSRIGKHPVNIPEGVKVELSTNLVTVIGQHGTLSTAYDKYVKVEQIEQALHVSPTDDSRDALMRWGLYRSLIQNNVIGVSKQYTRSLEMVGVGYRASIKGNLLNLSLGYSHDIKYLVPEGIAIQCEKPTLMHVIGINKQQVGEVCATIIKLRPPEPYKGKGVRYVGAYVRRKEAKKK